MSATDLTPIRIPPIGGSGGEGNIVSGSGNTAGTLATFSSGTVVFAGGNNITLSQSSNSISIIGAAGGTGGAAITLGGSNLGNTSGTSGVISGSALQFLLAGGNNVTLSQSLNGSSVTITVSAANQTNQSGDLFAVGTTFGTSSGTYDARSLSLRGSGAVGVAASNSGWVISAPAQSNQQLSMYAVSNTTLSTSSTGNASALSFEGAGGVSVGISNGSVVISGGAGGGGGNNSAGISNLGNTAGTSGIISGSAIELLFAGGNNVTLSQSVNGSTATISVVGANQSNQSGGVYASSNTFGTSSGTYDARSLSIAGSGAVSVAASNSGWVISAPAQTNQTLGLYAVSNTTLSTSRTADARSLSFEGAGVVSVGVSNGSVIISANAAAGDGVNIIEISGNTSGTTTSFSTGTIVLDGGNNITLSQSSNTITISGAAFSTITQGNMVTVSTAGSSVTIDAFANILSASGNTSGTLATFSSGTMVLAGGNNITLSQSSNTITISAGAGGGGGTLSMFAVSNTTLSTSGSAAATALSFEGAGAASIGISNNSVVVSAPVQTNQTIGLYAVSNTTLSTSRTADARSLSFEGAGIVSVGASNGSVIISATQAAQTNQSGGVYASSNTTVGTSGTYDARSLSIAGAGAISIEASNSGFIVSSPVESFLIAGNNISLSSNSNSITIANLLSQTVSQLEPWDFGANSSASSLGVSSLYFQHFNLPDIMQVCRADRLISLSINAAVSGSSNVTGTRSNVWTYNETVGLFTRGTGGSSTNLYSYMSNSWSFGITESVSIVTTAATDVAVNQSYTLGFVANIDTNGGTTSGTFSSATSLSSAGTSVSQANVLSNVSGQLLANIPFGSTLLSAGDYWFAILGRTATTTGGTSTLLASISNIVLTNYNSGLQRLGQTATATSNTLIPGNGVFSAQTSAFPSSVAINAISNNSNVSLYGNFMNVSL